MADSMGMSQENISALKDTLHAQQQLLQKLYNELDAEREASASAASEALSVILRLQGEKAAVKMEAEQYQRLAEEKMCHAEESLAIIEDIIYQKEMEVASLDYQVQAYRYKLLSIGCVDPGVGEIKFPENLLQRNECLAGETSLQSLGRRNSAPVSLKYKKSMNIERESSTNLENESIAKIVEEQDVNDQASDSDRKTDNSISGGINSYWEQIRKLDVRVKEIAGARIETRSPSSISSRLSIGNSCDPSNLPAETRSPSPQLSIGNSYETKRSLTVNGTQEKTNSLKNGVAVDYPCPPNVHDVFEVPQVDRNCISPEPMSKENEKSEYRGRESIESEDFVIRPESSKSYGKEEPDWLKKLLQSTNHGNGLCKPSEVAAVDCHLNVLQHRNSVSESQSRLLNQISRRSEIIESERTAEPNDKDDEVLTLLNEIKNQLNELHCEIRNQNISQSSVRAEPSLGPLSEAMLYFWL